MKPVCYVIDGENQVFKTLRDAKAHIMGAYTPNERIKYFGKETCYIIGYNRNDMISTLTQIKVDKKGKESFGKTMKF